MQFGSVLASLKDGKTVRRTTWGYQFPDYLYLVKGSTFDVNRPPLLGHLKEGDKVQYSSHIDAFKKNTVGPHFVRVWDFTQEDILAEDWVVVNDSA